MTETTCSKTPWIRAAGALSLTVLVACGPAVEGFDDEAPQDEPTLPTDALTPPAPPPTAPAEPVEQPPPPVDQPPPPVAPTPPEEEQPPPVEEPPPEAPPPAEPPPPTGPAVAPFDNDSPQAPAVEVFLRPTGDRAFAYADAISWPAGDETDFVGFTLPNDSNPTQNLRVSLDCTIDGPADTIVRATLWEDGVRTTRSVTCGDVDEALTVNNTREQVLEIHFVTRTAPVHVAFRLDVRGFR